MIPKPNYPNTLDGDQNLFFVSDGLRVVLSEDYNPGDVSISVFGDEAIMRSFDETGIITLTEQCSEPELRALSFHYTSRTLTSFNGLELLSGFIDCPKPKKATNVTQNVMSIHHNNLKDALVKIERFAGKKGDVGKYPLRGTMEERINYLRKLVLSPRAWFKVDKVVGLAPLTVEFTNQSFYLGTDSSAYAVKHVWDFGDNTEPLSTISTISIIDSTVPYDASNIFADVACPTSGVCKVQKTYSKPGIYDVKLTVTNDFGLYEASDTVNFPKMITVRHPAPDTATIEILERSGQNLTDGDVSPMDPNIGNKKPYTNTTPKIRATINSLIDVKIRSERSRLGLPGSYTDELGINRKYTGEEIGSGGIPDKITSYKWDFSDDLNHSNSSSTKALFGIGGYFDLVLRTDTEFKGYRITTYKKAFDIIENYNLWLWHTDETSVFAYEFGIISETFKIKGQSASIGIDSSFLSGASSARNGQVKKEFIRNNGCAKSGSSTSGDQGESVLYYSSGRDGADPRSNEKISFIKFNGFTDTHSSIAEDISRPWNWVGLNYNQDLYFVFGSFNDGAASVLQTKHKVDLSSSPISYESSTLLSSNYKNGATELLNNTASFVYSGSGDTGYYSVYRSAWHSDSGYILRNEGDAVFYRMSSFYKTSGNSAESFIDIKRLTDMPGSRMEGQLVSLSQGLYFFNNSGSVLAYGPNSGVWTSGGPGSNSASFRGLQDTGVLGFDDASQTFIAASDGDKIAFLSYDYSSKCFIKFNEAEMAFKSITNTSAASQASVSPDRESGFVQWQMYIF